MKLNLATIIMGFVIGTVGRFLLRQFWVINLDFFLGPIIGTFWRHALRQHPDPLLKCDQCAQALYDSAQ